MKTLKKTVQIVELVSLLVVPTLIIILVYTTKL